MLDVNQRGSLPRFSASSVATILRRKNDSAITRTGPKSKRAFILNTVPTLARSIEDQDARFASAFTVLKEAIQSHAFPAASTAVTHASSLIALKTFGSFVYEGVGSPQPLSPTLLDGDLNFPAVTTETMFDLASLTKPIATTTMAMQLYERGLLELDAPVVGVIPELFSKEDPRRAAITFRMLLAHSSGLPAYERLFLKEHSREDLLRAAFRTPLTANPGTRAEYSDLGFIVLGIALERLSGDSLDAYCQREIFGRVGMLSTTYNPPADIRSKIPPTADERRAEPEVHNSTAKPRSTFRGRIIQGEVQDENAFVLGGVAGHAGLFATAEDVARFANFMLKEGSPILRPETVSLFTRRESAPPGTSRTLGWDTPSSPSQSGKHFGRRSFGHLGYTGTSLWIDPDRQLSVTLLTNRTWPYCSNQAIKQIRPKFHDALIEALDR